MPRAGSFRIIFAVHLLRKALEPARRLTCSRKFEGLVVSKIKEHILTPENLTKLVGLVNEEIDAATSSYRHEMDTVLSEIRDVDRRLGNLYNFIENGNIDYGLLKSRLQELKTQHDKLLSRKAELELQLSLRRIEMASPEVVREYVDELHRFLDASDLPERRAFIKGFIREVRVMGNKGRIRYVFPVPPNNLEEEKPGVLPTVQYGGR